MTDKLDTLLITITAAVWLAVALIYHFSSLIDMPDGERVWTLSAVVFLLIMTWVLLSERRGALLRRYRARGEES